MKKITVLRVSYVFTQRRDIFFETKKNNESKILVFKTFHHSLFTLRSRDRVLFRQARTRSLCLRKLLKKPALASGRPITAATLLIGRNRVSIGDKHDEPEPPVVGAAYWCRRPREDKLAQDFTCELIH
ncbi:unnamed protein product, partial [Brenthis ino]